jgi:hypothetical protein
VTAAVSVAGSLVFAQSPEPIDLPDPRRMLVTGRLVTSGEFIVYDPVVIALRSNRPMPRDASLPGPHRVVVAGRMDSVYLAVPDPFAIGLLSMRHRPIQVFPNGRQFIVAADRMDSAAPAVPDPFAVGIALRIYAAELKWPETTGISTTASRRAPEASPKIEPLAMTAVLERRRADLEPEMPAARGIHAAASRRAPAADPMIEPLTITAMIHRDAAEAEPEITAMRPPPTTPSLRAPKIDRTVEPAPVTVPTQKPKPVDAAALRLLQARLKDRGYDPGPADGIMGNRTRRAIANFKADMASAVTLSDKDRDLLKIIGELRK